MSDTSILHWTLPQLLGERLAAFSHVLASHRRSGGVVGEAHNDHEGSMLFC